MKKHVVLISLGALNIFHSAFHLIQFVQSMMLVAYSTHQHGEEGWMDKIMHNPIFAVLMGATGILTLVIGVKDFRHHKKCETDNHGYSSPVQKRFKPGDVAKISIFKCPETDLQIHEEVYVVENGRHDYLVENLKGKKVVVYQHELYHEH